VLRECALAILGLPAGRAAEAAALRHFADEPLDGHGTERRLIVLGDLNDEMRAATTQIIQGPPGSEIGSRGEHRPDSGDARRLLNIAPLILPEEARFSASSKAGQSSSITCSSRRQCARSSRARQQ
jgi:endonuclease/exonuclease/phosphatase family metal-dependent hydrolase